MSQHPSRRRAERSPSLRMPVWFLQRPLNMKIDQERPEDVTVIRILSNAAFKDAPYSNQTEAKIVEPYGAPAY